MAWPTDITAMDKGRVLEVAFDDGHVIRLTAERLRVESPSAEVQGHSPSQKKIVTGKENVAIVAIDPVGNYAIKIVFDDGHDTGLYSWDYLRKLAELTGSSARSRNRQKRARIVPAMSHWKPSSAREILLMSFAFVRWRRAASIAAPTRDATT